MRCCGKKIGYDETSWGLETAYGLDAVTNIASDISLLNSVSVCFAGNRNTCGNAVRFDAADWETIRLWIVAGGRFFIVGEHSGDYPAPGETIKCLQDMPALNDFLSAITSSIRYVGGDYMTFQVQPDPGAAQMAHAGECTINRFGEVENGTSLWVGPSGVPGTGKVVVAVEQIGNGFVFVAGDSDMTGAFWARVWEDDDANII
jgi:hypothetical protein